MSSTTFFFVFIPILAIILLAVNLIFAPHNPYQEKNSAFECGFHSFLGQNRTQFSISFFIFALLFLLFDLEILLVYPYVVSAYTNGIYGLVIMLIFFLALTLGFAFELGKNALKIDSRQMFSLYNKKPKWGLSLVKSGVDSGIFSIDLLKLFNDLEHVYNMRSLVRLWVEYVINKSTNIQTITFNTDSFTLKALKDIFITIIHKNNFVHTPHVINRGLSLINSIDYCISHIHLVVPLIFPIIPKLGSYFQGFSDILVNLFNLSKKYWCYFLDKIIYYFNNILHKIILNTLNILIQEFKRRLINFEDTTLKASQYQEILDEFPLFDGPDCQLKLAALYLNWDREYDAIDRLLSTIRELECIILTHFNSNHVVLPDYKLAYDYSDISDDSD
jgi:NADH-ubiquinone oxidoreductase chain 3